MKNFRLSYLFLIPTLMLTACQDNDKPAEKDQRSTIVIASSGSPSPFTMVNDKGELIGYDVDTTKAIFAQLPQYNAVFEKTEFESILAGLDSERFNVGANNFAINEKRKEKYYYSDPIFRNQYVIAVAPDNNDIKQLSDLRGKSTEASPSQNYATALQNFNKANSDNPIKIDYTAADLLTVLRNIETNKYDFQLVDLPMLIYFIEKHNLKVNYIELSDDEAEQIASPYSYLLISKGKNGQQLTKDINKAIKKIIENGQLTEISETYFGSDYAPKLK